MCTLSLSDAVCKMDTKKEDLESGSRGELHYQIVGWVRIERKSDLLYSIGPIRPSSSFSFLSLFPVFLFLSRAFPFVLVHFHFSFSDVECRFETNGMVFFLYSADLRQVLFPRKSASVRVGRRMLWKSVLLGNSSKRESNAGLSMRMWKGFLTYCKLYRY